ncbi:TonB-dependent siderophore receptor [Apibacter sp. HY039]|uniref:TonB-dependent receptor plug domain-containing protein n=1 Tax=Apibacter sp. HY039 TaxID=2501476 RepID=UPI000FEBF27A|nr:TonB-dependent receptor plug domain-containing protein [Apibacter sp. HY039]
MKKILTFLCLLYFHFFYTQIADSLKNITIENIIILGTKKPDISSESKPLATMDEYMENSGKIDLIRRGNYGWEPSLNGMTSERISLTLDGMKLFNACTDKMDPVTSYVEISNLKNIQVSSGLQGGIHGGNSIGGNITMNLKKTGFLQKKWSKSLYTGYETNGNYFINGIDISHSNKKFYFSSGLFHRKSENYKSGGQKEIYFSQFEKTNLYTHLGYRISKSQFLESTFILDKATHVGYPALTMDVKKAEAWIGSLSYRKENISYLLDSWESKIYFNSITHIMDDTHRPNNPVHMDMPGRSNTLGFYSTVKGKTSSHSFIAHWDGFYNRSQAEMTMYPKNSDVSPMFMYTWPDIRTFNTSFFLEDRYTLDALNSFSISARWGYQKDGINEEIGLKSIQIFFPQTAQFNHRIFLKATAFYEYTANDFHISLGGGYGERTPSVSEAYGFYLFNNFDNFDYIGNPTLKNEKSWEGSFIMHGKIKSLKLETGSSYFYFNDYITGKKNEELSPMTLGAKGVKIYNSLKYASIFTTYLQLNYTICNRWKWSSRFSYQKGRDDKGTSLPLIAPFSYTSSILFNKNRFTGEFLFKGSGRQKNYDPDFGNQKFSDFIIYNFSTGYSFLFGSYKLVSKIGVENLLDKKYTTYSDWNNILRKGRNFFINISFDW